MNTLLSAIDIQTQNSNPPTIQGTATGASGDTSAISLYAGAEGDAKYGLVRFQTGQGAQNRFNTIWAASGRNTGTSNVLASLGSALLGTLNSLIPSTNPLGVFGNSNGNGWDYRPEYPWGGAGIYLQFLTDQSGFLSSEGFASEQFYNSGIVPAGSNNVFPASYYHKFTPDIPYIIDEESDDKTTGTSLESLAKILYGTPISYLRAQPTDRGRSRPAQRQAWPRSRRGRRAAGDRTGAGLAIS